MIDPGHGGKDSGATSHGVCEKDWTLEISLYQLKRFKELGVPVRITRDSDTTLASGPRSRLVRESGASLCISNHINAGGGSGCETIYSLFTNDRLARSIAEGLSAHGMPIHRVYSRKGQDGRDYYYMHRLTGKVETVIIEYGFIDNTNDFNKLKERNYRLELAEAVVMVICNWLAIPYKSSTVNVVETKSSKQTALYHVQVGAFKAKMNANNLAKRLRTDGYPAIVITERIDTLQD